MKSLAVVAASLVLSGLCAADAFAQGGVQWRGGGGWGPCTPYARHYDPRTVENLSAEVVSVDIVTPMSGMSQGVHLVVKSGEDPVSVHLGPSWFIENQDIQLEVGDRIELKGSRVTLGGAAVVIAAEVKKGEQVLVLRDAEGIPVWSGWRRR